MKLYSDNRNFSSSAKRVRLVCHEVGAPLEIVPMDFMKGEWKSPEYLAKNPNGKVPTLDDDGYILWESPAILFHVASKYSERGLVATDTRGRTEMLRWMFWHASHFEPAIFGVCLEKVLKSYSTPPLAPDAERVEKHTKDWERFGPILDQQLESRHWVLGAFSIVDIMIGTTVQFGAMAGLDPQKFPHLGAWYARLSARESWKHVNPT